MLVLHMCGWLIRIFFIQCHIGTNDAASYYTYLIEMRPIYYVS